MKMRHAFPYCLQLQPCGGYLILDRGYNAIGFGSNIPESAFEGSPYFDAHKDKSKVCEIKPLYFLGLTKKVIAKLSFNGDESPDAIFLYNSGCVPFLSGSMYAKSYTEKSNREYLKRLEILGQLELVDKSVRKPISFDIPD